MGWPEGHTGAAIAAEDSNRIVRLVEAGQKVRIRLVTSGVTHPDVESANVVAEIRGRERPDEIVLIGAHLDSWDVGTGASDDGAGCIVTWEALRLMKALGLRPRRTIRLVLFENEESGLRGASAYAERYQAHASRHVFALEADSGVSRPPARLYGSDAARQTMLKIGTLLAPLSLPEIAQGGEGPTSPRLRWPECSAMAYLGDPARTVPDPPYARTRSNASRRRSWPKPPRHRRRRLRRGRNAGTAAEVDRSDRSKRSSRSKRFYSFGAFESFWL